MTCASRHRPKVSLRGGGGVEAVLGPRRAQELDEVGRDGDGAEQLCPVEDRKLVRESDTPPTIAGPPPVSCRVPVEGDDVVPILYGERGDRDSALPTRRLRRGAVVR